jgi:uncharacterized membrane protein YfcA
MTIYIFVLAVGLIAGTLSGIVGTGASIMLLPILVFQFGPKQAVPIMAIAALMSNIGKVLAWWREINWRAFAAYSITGVPAAALGARTLLILPSRVVDVALGLFFLAMIPGRRLLTKMDVQLRLWQLSLAGAVIGFITGVVISTGPLSVPAFTSYCSRARFCRRKRQALSHSWSARSPRSVSSERFRSVPSSKA